MLKQQVVVIHGGDVYRSYEDFLEALKGWKATEYDLKPRPSWKAKLEESLGADFEVLSPRMPNAQNAKYPEWKIWFEKLIPFMRDDVLLVGHSLGGIFLAKYLSENWFPRKVRGLFLVAASYDGADAKHATWSGFGLGDNLSGVERAAERIFLYHSTDDPVVPFSDMEKYAKQFPRATVRVFRDRGHFRQDEFPELVADIRSF